MKNYLALLFLISIPTLAQSQTEGFDGFSNLMSSNTSMFRSFDNRYEGVTGQPTLFEDYVTGRVITKNGVKYNNVQINFDAYQNELVVLNRQKKPVIVNSAEIDSFMMVSPLDNLPLHFKKVSVEGKILYAQLLCDGKVKLFKHPGKKLERATYTGAYNQNGKRYDEFVETTEYYFQSDGNKLAKLVRTKKALSNIIPEKENEIERWIGKNKIKSDEDLKRLFEHINSL